MYPSFIVEYGVSPHHLSSKVFLGIVKWLRTTRLDAKHNGRKLEADALKIVINMGNDFERFVMVIEYNFQNELMMNEMEPIHEFIVKFVKDKKMCWGLSQHDDIKGVKITLVASK